MSVCPGCGRCRQCGQRTAPVYPWYGPCQPYVPPWQPTAPQPLQPIWVQPNPYYVGDPIPGTPGTTTITCQNTGGAI